MNIPAHFSGSEQALHEAAQAATGLSDFGASSEYREGLGQLLAALDSGPRFSPGGRETAWKTLVGVLVARLLSEQGWKDHPNCLAQPVRRPLIIMGVPRTGTTALHKLLSMDPQFQGMERWLTAFPMPRPAPETWADNPYYRACHAGLEAFFAAAPEMRAAHDMRADDVDECLEVLKQCFCSNYFGSSLRVPEYDRWWLEQNEITAYRRLRKVLQLIGAHSLDKTWLLKNPGHLWQVDALLETFPDACVIQTHRAPAKALPSLCSVLRQARGLSEGTHVDPKEIGERELAYWSTAVERSTAARQKAPDQFLDVHQRDIQQDPLTVVARIYQHFDLQLSAEAEHRMRRRISEAPEMQHGEHHYSAEDFGLDDQLINERFVDYRHRYGLG